MNEGYYLVRRVEDKYLSVPTKLLKDPSMIKLVDHPVRIRMLELLSKTPLFPAEIAKELGLHEQKVYYHLKQMDNAGVVEVVEKKDIRGTTAKKYASTELSFSVSMSDDWKEMAGLGIERRDRTLGPFLDPFITDGMFNSQIVVGSPEPHGPLKASARDGHYAIDLGVFLGHHCKIPEDFTVSLDVDIHLKNTDKNLIIVGGPVTNMTGKELNEYLPVKFSDTPPWGLSSERTGRTYTEENTGIICRIVHPHRPKRHILYLAGIRGVGTKSAVLALSRHYNQLLQSFGGQKSWMAVVHGFDLDGDGKIDSIEIAEQGG